MKLVFKIKRLYERNPSAKNIVDNIAKIANQLKQEGFEHIKIMNFCGTHEWTISHYGIRSLMPDNVELIAGPGCPVCITPGSYVRELIRLSFEGYSILTYGDAYRLPTGNIRDKIRSLADARSLGGDVTIVYSFLDAVKIAKKNPGKKHVFFAIGFETTMPSTAELLYRDLVPENLLILSAYRYTPPIMRYLLEKVKDVEINGVIAPGHVSAVIGSNAWRFLAEEYNVPVIVSGFEPIDVLLSILLILKQIKENKARLVNEYKRVVRPEGNLYAKEIMKKVYEVRDAYWRGIGIVPKSGGYLSKNYEKYDVMLQLGVKEEYFKDVLPGCKCGEVSLGKAKPTDCPLFMKTCTPENPYGPCMVSIEGTCRIWAENAPLRINL
ncbi:hydrogenase formation protein HypD [Desulfurococcaceae archaeon MEX13E-LK6-19]|nr:hydrogenase formation protein HypD [Desulfurococcaceae archaeon MEX13E-LK6-19]